MISNSCVCAHGVLAPLPLRPWRARAPGLFCSHSPGTQTGTHIDTTFVRVACFDVCALFVVSRSLCLLSRFFSLVVCALFVLLISLVLFVLLRFVSRCVPFRFRVSRLVSRVARPDQVDQICPGFFVLRAF